MKIRLAFDKTINYLKRKYFLIIVLGIVVSLLIKCSCMSFKGVDWKCFNETMTQYKSLGFIGSLKLNGSLDSYTPFFNYFLIFISLVFPEQMWLHAMKTVVILFEVLGAIATYFIIKKITKNKSLSSLSFSIYLVLPTIILNGAWWGQCDAVYVSFILWSIYFLLCDKSHLCMTLYGVAFSIKLQSIFILPIYLYFTLRKHIKIYQFLYIPAIYIIIALPHLFAGRSFISIIDIYFKQTGIFEGTRTACPNLYGLINISPLGSSSGMRIIEFILFIIALCIYCYFIIRYKPILDFQNIILLILSCSFLCVYFLPAMHERYYIIAEMLSFIYFMIKKDKLSMLLFIFITLSSVLVIFSVGIYTYVPNLLALEGIAFFTNLVSVYLLFLENKTMFKDGIMIRYESK